MSGRFVALAVIAGMLLAGCGSSGGAAPRTTPAVAATSTSSTSPVAPSTSPPPGPPTVPADVPTTGPNLKYRGEKPPVMPALATQHTRSGAVAFAEFFLKTIDWGYATTSSAYMRHYFGETCTTCAGVAAGLDQQAQKGNHFIGDRFTIAELADRPGGANGASLSVRFHIQVGSSQLLSQTGRFVDGERAFSAEDEVAVTWRADAWTVVAMSVSR